MVLADEYFTDIDYSVLDRVVAIMAQKGGVGKTSLAANLAGLSAKADVKTLLIDLDPQANLLDEFGVYADERVDEGEHLRRAILESEPLRPIIANVRPNLDLIPGGLLTREISSTIAAQKVTQTILESGNDVSIDDGWNIRVPAIPDHIAGSPVYHARLAKVLVPLIQSEGYELVIIDSPPNEQHIQQIILGASRYVVIPTAPDLGSIRAIHQIVDAAADTEDAQHEVTVLGAVLIGVGQNETRVRRQAEIWMSSVLDSSVPLFETAVRSATAAAQQARLTGDLLFEMAEKLEGYKPWKDLKEGRQPKRRLSSIGALAGDYFLLVDEILKRIDNVENFGQVEDLEYEDDTSASPLEVVNV